MGLEGAGRPRRHPAHRMPPCPPPLLRRTGGGGEKEVGGGGARDAVSARKIAEKVSHMGRRGSSAAARVGGEIRPWV